MSGMTVRQFRRHCQEQRDSEQDEQRWNAYDKVIRHLDREPRCAKTALVLTLALWGKAERERATKIRTGGFALMVAETFNIYEAVFEELRCILTGELTVEGLPHLLRLVEPKAVMGMQEQGGIYPPKEALTYLIVCMLSLLQGNRKEVFINQEQIHLLLDIVLGKLSLGNYALSEDFPYQAEEILRAFELA